MFRRKLTALDYHNPDGFDNTGKEAKCEGALKCDSVIVLTWSWVTCLLNSIPVTNPKIIIKKNCKTSAELYYLSVRTVHEMFNNHVARHGAISFPIKLPRR